MFQSVEKDEARQAFICTILSASNTSLWRLLWKRLFQKKQEGKERLRRVGRGGKWEKSWLEKMERDSSVWCSMLFTFLFPGGFWGLQGWGHHSSADSVFACVRETVSA